ncbi:MAG: ExeA family protein [Candidatus Methylomirabilales bacterium]
MTYRTQSRYGLAKEPFTKQVPVEELFDHTAAQAARGRLKAAIEGHASAVLSGESGTGKTFVFRALEAQLPQGHYRVTYIHNAHVNLRDFYRQLSAALGLEPRATPAALFRMVSHHIEELATTQRLRPLLVLDEAHLLPISVLSHLHILLNFHRDSSPLLSLLLLGLPELRERLTRNILNSLAARLPVRVVLNPLGKDRVCAYLQHRMRKAGASQEVFSEDAALMIAEATGGIMRKIDVLASTALEVAAQGKSSLVDAAVVQEAVNLCAEALV